LIQKLDIARATIGIIGLGYVGLPLSLRFVAAGYSVIGLDIDPSKTDKLNAGISYISHIESSRIQQALASGFTATTDFARVSEVDGVILCVPTPLNPDREPDLSFVIQTIESICPYLKAGQVISLESTTYPGTTEEEIFPRISATGLETGKEIFLVYSPEREDPGNPDFDAQKIPKICGGYTEQCLEVGLALYNNAIDVVVPVSSVKVAEMTKLLENIYRAVNIGMVNEMKIVADRMGINIYEVIEAAKTKPFGFTPFYPGPGLGGHCIPIDPFYLSWKARKCGIETRFIELAGEVNTSMPAWIVGKVEDALRKSGKTLDQADILILGIAYKKNIDDMRESPAVAIMELLQQAGSKIAYSDPFVPVFPPMRNYFFDLSTTPLTENSISQYDVMLTENSISQYDVILITTDHDCFDYELIRNSAKLVVDTRGRYAMCEAYNVISA
jgi:UDP-N-acetyl-D-glucosamine dehydrogenase